MADVVLLSAGAYALCGAVFALVFITCGVHVVDQAASGASLSFRLLIAPGCAALWPLMLARWMRTARRPAGVSAREADHA